MINYMKTVEGFFWDNLEEDELIITDENFTILDHALRLMELNDDDRANQEIDASPELKELFGFKFEKEDLLVLEQSEPSVWESDYSEDEVPEQSQTPTENIRPSRFDTSDYKDEPFNNDYKDYAPESSAQGAKRPRQGGFEDYFKRNNPQTQAQNNTFGIINLNIDCDKNRRKNIDRWLSEMSLLIQTDEKGFDTSDKVLLLADHKSSGILNKFIKNIQWTTQGLSPTRFLNVLHSAVYLNFLGIDVIATRDHEIKLVKDKAEENMTKMQLCDICFLDQFYCDYEKNFFELNTIEEYEKYIQLYLRKIPIVGEKSRLRFEQERSAASKMSLAFAQRIVKDEIKKICDLSKTQKKLKKFNKSCCPSLIETQRLEYGCSTTYKKKKSYLKSRFKKEKKKKRFFKKDKKPFKPSRYARKPFKPSRDNKEKFCPKGKKNCRCWICSEQGHYANECPNKKDNPNQVFLLEEILSKGLVPIEDEYLGEHHVYEFIEILEPEPPDSTTDESSSSSSDSSGSSSD